MGFTNSASRKSARNLLINNYKIYKRSSSFKRRRPFHLYSRIFALLMRTFISLLKHSRFFLLPFGLFLIVAGIVLSVYTKENIHLKINSYNNSFGDFIMPWVTLMADGITITVFVLMMFAWNRKFALTTGVACLFSSGITQLLKHTIYYGMERPKLFFANLEPLHFIKGVQNELYDTFPSGHTTVAFALFFCLVFATKNNFLKTVFFLLALLIGYSRIYLSQHFLGDVFAGSIIGTLSSLLIFTIASKKKWLELPNVILNNEE